MITVSKKNQTAPRSGKRFWTGSAIFGLTAGLAQTASAAITSPTIPAGLNSQVCTANDYICLMGGYWKAGILILAIILCGVALLRVAGGLMGKYDEYRKGRADVGDLKESVIVAVVTLAVVTSLAYYAAYSIAI